MASTIGLALAAAKAGLPLVVEGALMYNLYEANKNGQLYTKPNDFSADKLFIFPYNLPQINGQTFCILFNFYKYDRPSILYPPTLKSYGSIALPIPGDLLDDQSLDYASTGSNPIAGMALENSKGLTDSSNWTNPTALMNGIQAGAGGAGLAAADNQFGKAAVGKVLQMAGLAQNPFLSVLFNAPNFKRYVFKWTFIPENANDSATLRTILDKFRYHSLPDVAGGQGGLLLTYPDMVVPRLIPTPFLYDMKQCVVEDISINYAPGSTVAFFPSNAPNAITLTVRLLEIEYWVKSDLLSANYHSTSYAADGSGEFINSKGLYSQNQPAYVDTSPSVTPAPAPLPEAHTRP